MAAAYDTYDYPSYWKERDYEHKAEVVAIRNLLDRIPKIGKLLDAGAGFGRLTSYYYYRADKIIISDPSARLLKIARARFTKRKVRFIQSRLENLPKKIKSKSVDVVLLVRVLHHIENLDNAIATAYKLLNKNGYFILEFANKRHLKATILEFFKGNLTFAFDIFPKRVGKAKPQSNTLPFVNHHPDIVKETLRAQGFQIVDFLSVSNIRSTTLKKYIPVETLIYLEERLQRPLGKVLFGPSIFILAQKRG